VADDGDQDEARRHERVLDYQGRMRAEARPPVSRKRKALVGMWIGFRVAYWLVALGMIGGIVFLLKWILGTYQKFMPG
jgi:hypothetical protein